MPAFSSALPRSSAAWWPFSRPETRQLSGLYGFIGLLHLLGWGLYLHYASEFPALVGLGFVAYMFGLRHAFDADHIAAVDDTVRYMLQKRQGPLAVGFFFSLGHSTIVFGLAVGIAFTANAVRDHLSFLRESGALIGACVSGTFLWVVGVLNLVVLLDLLKMWKTSRSRAHNDAHLDMLLQNRGLLNRLFGGRLRYLMNHSWQMYPLGLLFGLGFDTASEVGLLAMTAGASTGNFPIPAVLCLPILFAAGMSLIDTTDGVLMSKAYDWAFLNPLRKIFYNLTTTSLTVAVALLVGTIELCQVFIRIFGLTGQLFDFVAAIDLSKLGYAIVGLFLLAWGLSVGWWSARTALHAAADFAHAAAESPTQQRPQSHAFGIADCGANLVDAGVAGPEQVHRTLSAAPAVSTALDCTMMRDSSRRTRG
jgi:nickel/cobalt transporter (NiCoT) family protein